MNKMCNILACFLIGFSTLDSALAEDNSDWTIERHVDTFANRAVLLASKFDADNKASLTIYCNPHYNPATRESDTTFGPYIHVHLITTLDYGDSDPQYQIEYRVDRAPIVKAYVDYNDGVFAFLEPNIGPQVL